MGPKLASLDGLRGIAAFLVVLFHVQDVAGRHGHVVTFHGGFGAGDRGVDLFFVLSGFIITWSHADDVGVPSRAARYAVRRATRIYPAVWITTAAAAIAYLLKFGGAAKSFKLEPWNVVASVLMLPQRQPALVNVTWTLTYEIFFYAIFGLMILRARLGLWLFGAWQLAVLLTALGVLQTSNWLIGYYLQPISLEFGIGLVAALLVARAVRHAPLSAGPSWRGVALVISGATIFFGGIAFEGLSQQHVLEPARLLFYGLGPAALIGGTALIESRRHIRLPPFLRWLGAISYVLYLVNFSVITLGWMVLSSRLSITPDLAGFGCIGLALATAGVFHRWVDTPIQRAFRALAPASRGASPAKVPAIPDQVNTPRSG